MEYKKNCVVKKEMKVRERERERKRTEQQNFDRMISEICK